MISIVSLIYKSTSFADAVYNSVNKYTPMLNTGDAEFFFVANDASSQVLEHLQKKNYKYFVNTNQRKTEEELFAVGIGWPEYIHRVYRGWNEAIRRSADIVVLINSDNLFSPMWLENLFKNLSETTVVCSQLVERLYPKGIFPGAYRGEFGSHPSNFNEAGFLKFCKQVSKPGIREGGAFMPCMFYKKHAEQVGLYPEGNIAGDTFNNVVEYGDAVFMRKLREIGVRQITALDSIVFHFKEGEMDE